ncbi:single-stranded-DNA-specific exonuclease RecJ [Kangiella sediminilitoris]|uniref:single-stranded-DNA-specific exonuclease RecJ n=1 Tax=Kangiella sediminilitoris TaxID=1144748 RepID=UPI00083E47B9
MKIRRREAPEVLPLTDSDLLNRIYANRGVTSKDELSYELSELESFHSLKDIDTAVSLLWQSLKNNESILIVGDFDADGATSSALAKLVLSELGMDVDYLVPNRFDYGYGLSPELVEVAKEMKPDLIITVDNGISSIAGVRAAKEAGIKVLVTDHHLAGDELPKADAIVNPNQPGDEFPSKNLAGVGVIFYVLLAFRAFLRDEGWFEKEGRKLINLARYLDLVALGTVADVVPLDKNNRILVHHGLKLIRAMKCRPGIVELLRMAKRDPVKIKSSDLGFAVGPRLNAAGRLDDMGLGIECLLAETASNAKELAQVLHTLNSDRQQVEQEMQDEALSQLDSMDFTEDDSFSLCLYEPHWHQGVVGLVASRLKERSYRPCIVFANADDTFIKGSGRSVKEVHIRDALALVDARNPNLIEKFGGHAMAAGLSIEKQKFSEFKAAFEEAVRTVLGSNTLQDVIETDGALSVDEYSLEHAQLLAQSGPFGQGFVEPAFDDEFEVLNKRIVGENHLKLTLRKEGCPLPISAIAFRIEPQKWEEPVDAIRAVFRPDINDYYQPELQLIISHLEAV